MASCYLVDNGDNSEIRMPFSVFISFQVKVPNSFLVYDMQ